MEDSILYRERNIMLHSLYEIFTKYKNKELSGDQFEKKCDKIIDKYDKKVYSNELSVSIRNRFIAILNELNLNPLYSKGIENIANEVGVFFTYEKGWYINIDQSENNVEPDEIEF